MNLWGLFAFSVFMAHAQTHERIRLDDLGGLFIDKTEVLNLIGSFENPLE